MLRQGPDVPGGGVKLMEPSFGEPVPQSGRYVGKPSVRGKQRKVGAGFTAKSYGAGTGRLAASVEQSPLVMSNSVLSVRASSQRLASRLAGYGRAAAGDNDTVRQALMDMLSSDWSTPASVAGCKTRVSRAETAPAPASARLPRLPPISTARGTAVICDPHSSHAEPADQSEARGDKPAPVYMARKPLGAEPRHSRTLGRFVLGSGDIETQVAAVAQQIRAARSSGELARRSSDRMPVPTTSPPRRSVLTLTVPNPASPGSDAIRPIDSRPMRPRGRPRVAETSEDRARKAVDSLTNRYTARLSTAAENAQIVGRADPTWAAAEIQRCSSHPGASTPAHDERKRAPVSPERSEKQSSSRTPKPAVREAKPKVDTRRPKAADHHTKTATRRPQVADRQTGADTGSGPSDCLVGKTKNRTERFAEMLQHDMEAENGLTGWGDLDG